MSQTNVRRIVRLTANRGAGRRMREALILLQQDTLREPGCAEFEFLQSLVDEDVFLLIEDFRSPADLEGHMQAPHTKTFFDLKLMASGAPIDKAWLS